MSYNAVHKSILLMGTALGSKMPQFNNMNRIPAIRVVSQREPTGLYVFPMEFSVAISPDQNSIVIFSDSDIDPATMIMRRSFKVGYLARYSTNEFSNFGKIAIITRSFVKIHLGKQPLKKKFIKLNLYDFCSMNWI